jgi:hypothetical protein
MTAINSRQKLKPILRLFVDGILAGEKPTVVVRRIRPELRRPDVLAAKWKKLPAVVAALQTQADANARLAASVERIEQHFVDLIALLRLPEAPP